ncbi:MAG: phytanoyl-CoA dioxygenase family protein [Candidatus Poribacteria bacterium]
MDGACLDHLLTTEEAARFESDGYFVVENAVGGSRLADLVTAADRVYAEEAERQGLPEGGTLNELDLIGRDEAFLEMLDWPATFPKVWGILGWNIQLYHSHMIVTPPQPAQESQRPRRLGWHQDSGRLNAELEGEPRPRVSLKVGFFLSDTSEPGRGNFHVVPGSHLRNTLAFPADGVLDPRNAVSICAPPGAAVFFDRRLWHSASPNSSDMTRKVLFYGYSYRWLRPRDNMTVDHYLARCDPIRRQLLGASVTGGMGYTSPRDEDVPLRAWLAEHAPPGDAASG